MTINNIRVLHIVAGAGTGGAETFCLDAIKALHDMGVKQHVICRPHAHYIDAFQARGIAYQTMRFGFFEKFGIGQIMIKAAVAGFKPDVVQAWMGRAASFVPKLSVPVLGWFGGYYDLKRYKNCDFYAGVTRDIARHIAEASGLPERTFVLHTFGTLEDQPAVERKSLDTPEDAPVVLLLSRMHWKKGVDTLLNAALKLPGVYFWLAGMGRILRNIKRWQSRLASMTA